MTTTQSNGADPRDSLDRLLSDPDAYFEAARREVERNIERESRGLSSGSVRPRIGFRRNPG